MNIIELTKTKDNKADFNRMRTLLKYASNDPTRQALHYILVEANEHTATLTATDGRRLRSDQFELEAKAGLYEIKTNTAKMIYLVKSSCEYTFPNYKQVIPDVSADKAYALNGTGSNFVLWASAGLKCRISPELLAVNDEESFTMYISKEAPSISPVTLINDTTTVVVMPIRVTDEWADQMDRMAA